MSEQDTEADAFIMIQPRVQWVAQHGLTTDEHIPDPWTAEHEEVFQELSDAMEAFKPQADTTEHGFQVTQETLSEYEKTKVTERTLIKVYSAFMKSGIDRVTAKELVKAIEREGVVFREKQ